MSIVSIDRIEDVIYIYLNLAIQTTNKVKVKTRDLECSCHRCNYRWQYHGNSKYIACCPRCKMTIYLPKMLRLMNEERIDIKSRSPDVELRDRNIRAIYE